MEALPEWLNPLPDAERMRAIDRWAIEVRGVPSLDLMERAGAGIARAVERLVPDGPAVVVCGRGNNGGDGLVVARLLRDAGREVTVLCTAPPAELSGDAQANLKRLPGAAPLELAQGGDALGGASIVVDALLGTGFAGEPRGAVAEAIAAVESCSAPVLSVDVPSGVDASTGVVSGPAVGAAITVTFHASKPGLWIHPGKAHAGEVEVLDIGIPRGAPPDAEIGLIAPAVLEMLPRRSAASTKFSSGHVLVAGGSRGLTGAPRMAALGAMRAGAGYVTACVPASLQAILASGPPELMTRGLPDSDGALTPAGVEVVLEAARRGGALVLGPGLGRGEHAVAFARALARRAEVPLVLDADGLNAHADNSAGSHGGGHLDDLAERDAATVLTPHPGELARLLDIDDELIARERLAHARLTAQRARAVVVLKGDDTLVADPSGLVAVSPGDSPALATAGTGDVLAGVIAALLAQDLPAFAAASAGVFLHAQAGRLASAAQGAAEGVIASDLIAQLPAARGAGGGRPAHRRPARGRDRARRGGPGRGRSKGGGGADGADRR
ncbi:MAG TPA: NAD(P)H-hydrate dehydratase [Solirubrobacteraceae bacterium]|nr:NAD(P)H-hydrate dehydratase [Solirubrobacteraceae bacterium]